jgi:hypothetical protein
MVAVTQGDWISMNLDETQEVEVQLEAGALSVQEAIVMRTETGVRAPEELVVLSQEVGGRTSFKEAVHANQGSRDVDLDRLRAVEVWRKNRVLREDLIVSSVGREGKSESSLPFFLGPAVGKLECW